MKTLDEFVSLFAEQFDDTDASEIDAQTSFHDLEEWDSLIALAVLNMGEEMRKAITIEDLYKTVISKL